MAARRDPGTEPCSAAKAFCVMSSATLQRGLRDGRIGAPSSRRVNAPPEEARTGKEPFLATSIAQEIERVFMRGSGLARRAAIAAGDAPRRLNFREGPHIDEDVEEMRPLHDRLGKAGSRAEHGGEQASQLLALRQDREQFGRRRHAFEGPIEGRDGGIRIIGGREGLNEIADHQPPRPLAP